jgi:hypothetical protein
MLLDVPGSSDEGYKGNTTYVASITAGYYTNTNFKVYFGLSPLLFNLPDTEC